MRENESVLVSLSDSDDPAAFSSRDYRDGNALPPGARASPEAVDKIYEDVTKKVKGLEKRVKKLKKNISGNEEVNIVLGSRGPAGSYLVELFRFSMLLIFFFRSGPAGKSGLAGQQGPTGPPPIRAPAVVVAPPVVAPAV
jgi:hypothetical protein